jgi:hypothetical protein
MSGRMSGSVSAALSGSGSCDFVPGSGSGSCCHVPGSGSCDLVSGSGSGSGSCDLVSGSGSGSGSGCEAYHYDLHMLPGRVSEA